ncbi:hypothetical protein [Sulfitobacter sp.]|uniref:hypothetical protein n=1 Tax=Sulfitobacter sp. TaxID=1903071 RepID=UPI00300237C0
MNQQCISLSLDKQLPIAALPDDPVKVPPAPREPQQNDPVVPKPPKPNAPIEEPDPFDDGNFPI